MGRISRIRLFFKGQKGEKRSMASYAVETAPGRTEDPTKQQKLTVHQRHSTEFLALRALQIVLFFMSYLFARTTGDVHEWEVEFEWTLLVTLSFALLFAVLTDFLPKRVPSFLAVMALPPFVDDMNLEYFFRNLLDDHMAPEEAARTMDEQ